MLYSYKFGCKNIQIHPGIQSHTGTHAHMYNIYIVSMGIGRGLFNALIFTFSHIY